MLICHVKTQPCGSFVGCKYGICRKYMCTSLLASLCLSCLALKFYSSGHPEGTCPPKTSHGAHWEGRQSLAHCTLFFVLPAAPKGLCYTFYALVTSMSWAEGQRALLTWTWKTKQSKGKQFELSLRWLPAWVATLTKFPVTMMKAQCYWYKQSAIDLRSSRFCLPLLLFWCKMNNANSRTLLMQRMLASGTCCSHVST